MTHAGAPSRRAVDPYAEAPRLPEGEGIDPSQLLAAQTAVELEIGPGRGGFILERLQRSSARIFGLEIRRKWATLVDRRIAGLGLSGRGRVFAEDARLALPRLLPASLSRVYVHFPDPWWKKRHQKRLLASAEFAEQMARVLVPGGEFFAQTDVPARAQLFLDLFSLRPEFELLHQEKWASDPDFGARSPRERRALEDQLPIYRVHLRRRP